ncbi:hypothetical protein BB559_000106 [Furculomyces boomerangus]|uniref:PH domain-containing protein n=1 Tax=Furculomyces boomerangus TaxID=61424 RepID=A0A2T9YD76_9FUNG|nr:hypothetical protein BB559_004709 [Furculomyces boomerangus]PVV00111.1 hypothetical protein BB559_000106 [Furculomyces boomerangus]
MFSRKKSTSSKNEKKKDPSEKSYESPSSSKSKPGVWSKLVSGLEKNDQQKPIQTTSQSLIEKTPKIKHVFPEPKSNQNPIPVPLHSSTRHNSDSPTQNQNINYEPTVQDLWFDFIIYGDFPKVQTMIGEISNILMASRWEETPYHEALAGIASDALGPDTTGMDGLQVAIIVYKNSHADWRLGKGLSHDGYPLSSDQMRNVVSIREDILELLLNIAQPIHLNENRFGVYKNTTLHLASFFNDINLVSRLLAQGANPSIENELGFTPAMITTDSNVRTLLTQHLKYLMYEKNFAQGASGAIGNDDPSDTYGDIDSSNALNSDPENSGNYIGSQPSTSFDYNSYSSGAENSFQNFLIRRLSTVVEEPEDEIPFYDDDKYSIGYRSMILNASVSSFVGTPIIESESIRSYKNKNYNSDIINSSDESLDMMISDIKPSRKGIDSLTYSEELEQKIPNINPAEADVPDLKQKQQSEKILGTQNQLEHTLPESNFTKPEMETSSPFKNPNYTPEYQPESENQSNSKNKSKNFDYDNKSNVGSDLNIKEKELKNENRAEFENEWNRQSMIIDPNSIADTEVDQLFQKSGESLNNQILSLEGAENISDSEKATESYSLQANKVSLPSIVMPKNSSFRTNLDEFSPEYSPRHSFGSATDKLMDKKNFKLEESLEKLETSRNIDPSTTVSNEPKTKDNQLSTDKKSEPQISNVDTSTSKSSTTPKQNQLNFSSNLYSVIMGSMGEKNRSSSSTDKTILYNKVKDNPSLTSLQQTRSSLNKRDDEEAIQGTPNSQITPRVPQLQFTKLLDKTDEKQLDVDRSIISTEKERLQSKIGVHSDGKNTKNVTSELELKDKNQNFNNSKSSIAQTIDSEQNFNISENSESDIQASDKESDYSKNKLSYKKRKSLERRKTEEILRTELYIRSQHSLYKYNKHLKKKQNEKLGEEFLGVTESEDSDEFTSQISSNNINLSLISELSRSRAEKRSFSGQRRSSSFGQVDSEKSIKSLNPDKSRKGRRSSGYRNSSGGSSNMPEASRSPSKRSSLPGRHGLGITKGSSQEKSTSGNTKSFSNSGASNTSILISKISSGSQLELSRVFSSDNPSSFNNSMEQPSHSMIHSENSVFGLHFNQSGNSIKSVQSAPPGLKNITYSSKERVANLQKKFESGSGSSSNIKVPKFPKSEAEYKNLGKKELSSLLPHGSPSKSRRSSGKSSASKIEREINKSNTDSNNKLETKAESTKSKTSSISKSESEQNVSNKSEISSSSKKASYGTSRMIENIDKSVFGTEKSKPVPPQKQNNSYPNVLLSKSIKLEPKTEILSNSKSSINSSDGIVNKSIEKLSNLSKKEKHPGHRRESGVLTKIKEKGLVKGRLQMFNNTSDPFIYSSSSNKSTEKIFSKRNKAPEEDFNDPKWSKQIELKSSIRENTASTPYNDDDKLKNNSTEIITSIVTNIDRNSINTLTPDFQLPKIHPDEISFVLKKYSTTEEIAEDKVKTLYNPIYTLDTISETGQLSTSKQIRFDSESESALSAMHQGRDYTSNESRAIISADKGNASNTESILESGISDFGSLRGHSNTRSPANTRVMQQGRLVQSSSYDSGSLSSRAGEYVPISNSSMDIGYSTGNNSSLGYSTTSNTKTRKGLEIIPKGIVAKRMIMQASLISKSSNQNSPKKSETFETKSPTKSYKYGFTSSSESTEKGKITDQMSTPPRLKTENRAELKTPFYESSLTKTKPPVLQKLVMGKRRESSTDTNDKPTEDSAFGTSTSDMQVISSDYDTGFNYATTSNEFFPPSNVQTHEEKRNVIADELNASENSLRVFGMASELVNNDSVVIHGSTSIFSSIDFSKPRTQNQYKATNPITETGDTDYYTTDFSKVSSNSLKEFLTSKELIDNHESYELDTILEDRGETNRSKEFTLTERLNELYISYAASRALLTREKSIAHHSNGNNGLEHGKTDFNESPSKAKIIFPVVNEFEPNLANLISEESVNVKNKLFLNHSEISSNSDTQIKRKLVLKNNSTGINENSATNIPNPAPNSPNPIKNKIRSNSFLDEVDIAIQSRLKSISSTSNLFGSNFNMSLRAKDTIVSTVSKKNIGKFTENTTSSGPKIEPSSLPWFITPLNGCTVNNFFTLPTPKAQPGYLYMKILSIEDLVDLKTISSIAQKFGRKDKLYKSLKIVLIIRNGVDSRRSIPISIDDEGKMQVNQEFIILLDPSKPITCWLRLQVKKENSLNYQQSPYTKFFNMNNERKKRFSFLSNILNINNYSPNKRSDKDTSENKSGMVKMDMKLPANFIKRILNSEFFCVPAVRKCLNKNTRSGRMFSSTAKRKPVVGVFNTPLDKNVSIGVYSSDDVSLEPPLKISTFGRRHSAPSKAFSSNLESVKSSEIGGDIPISSIQTSVLKPDKPYLQLSDFKETQKPLMGSHPSMYPQINDEMSKYLENEPNKGYINFNQISDSTDDYEDSLLASMAQVRLNEDRGYSSEVEMSELDKTIIINSQSKASRKMQGISGYSYGSYGPTIFTPKDFASQQQSSSDSLLSDTKSSDQKVSSSNVNGNKDSPSAQITTKREGMVGISNLDYKSPNNNNPNQKINHRGDENVQTTYKDANYQEIDDDETFDGSDSQSETLGCAAIHVGEMLDEVHLKLLVDSWDVISVWEPTLVCRLQLQLFYIPIPQSAAIPTFNSQSSVDLSRIVYSIYESDLPRSIGYCQMSISTIEWHNRTWASGYLSQLGGDCTFWKRRYYKLIGGFLVAYKVDDRNSSQCVIDISAATRVVSLKGNSYETVKNPRNLKSDIDRKNKNQLTLPNNRFEPKLTPRKTYKLKGNAKNTIQNNIINEPIIELDEKEIFRIENDQVIKKPIKTQNPVFPQRVESMDLENEQNLNTITFSFRLIFGSHGAIDFYADSEQEMNKWLNALKGMINKVPKIPLWLVKLIHEDISLQIYNHKD